MAKQRISRKLKKKVKLEIAINEAHQKLVGPFNQVKPEDAGAFAQDALKNQNVNGFAPMNADWFNVKSRQNKSDVDNGINSVWPYEGEDIAQ